MKIPTLPVLLILAASAASLFATPDTDRQATDAAMKAYNIRVMQNHVTVTVTDGVATLTGTADTQESKDMAGDTVSNIPGVTSVNNKIVVEPTIPVHSDAWIAAKIRLQLLVRSNVSLAHTTVAVKDGVVILSGTADNAAQKDLTGVYARNIEGVKSVENNLVVMTSPPPASSGETVGESIDDASITVQLKYALLTDRGTSAVKTKVTTTNGVVIITGEAGSEAEKTLVTTLAQSIRGVKSVVNNMTVKAQVVGSRPYVNLRDNI